MSGHSKWANIKHAKGKADAQRGKVFTRIAKELMVVARAGGANPDANVKLKALIVKAREANMPSDTVNRAIQKGAGLLDGVSFEELNYEGYGPGGIAVMLDILTDNRNRTAGEIRHLFDRNGGNLGETGSVGWMFEKKGLIVIDREEVPLGEDEMMMIALEAGAEDMKVNAESYEIITAPEDFEAVKEAIAGKNIKTAAAELTKLPKNTVEVTGESITKVQKLLDALDDHDDVQNLYDNADFKE